MIALTPHEVDEFVAASFPATLAAGFRCDALGEGFAVARWRHDPAALRPGALISGPTQFTAADLALWFLSFTVFGLAAMAVTTDLHIAFLRPRAGETCWRAPSSCAQASGASPAAWSSPSRATRAARSRT